MNQSGWGLYSTAQTTQLGEKDTVTVNQSGCGFIKAAQTTQLSDWKETVTVNQSGCGSIKAAQTPKPSDARQVSPDRVMHKEAPHQCHTPLSVRC